MGIRSLGRIERLLNRLCRCFGSTTPLPIVPSVVPFKRNVRPRAFRYFLSDSERGVERVPKANYPEIINGRKGEGPAYEYATLSIAGRNDPIILAVEPVRHSSTWEGDDGELVSWAEIVDRLMQQATELVDIHLVLADREFENREVSHVLDQYHDVTYLLPKKKNSKLTKQEVADVKYDPTLKGRVRPATLYLDENRTRYVDAETDDTVGEKGLSHDLNFMYVPAKDDEYVHIEENDVKYTVFITNREDVSAADAIGLVDRYSRRWNIEIEHKMIKPLLPSIASKDFRMRYFSFVFSCLLYNIWRLDDHSLKVLVTEAYDDYVRSRWDDRLDPLVTMPDFLPSALVLMFCDGGLDPPD